MQTPRRRGARRSLACSRKNPGSQGEQNGEQRHKHGLEPPHAILSGPRNPLELGLYLGRVYFVHGLRAAAGAGGGLLWGRPEGGGYPLVWRGIAHNHALKGRLARQMAVHEQFPWLTVERFGDLRYSVDGGASGAP